jgi:hypothetical protein
VTFQSFALRLIQVPSSPPLKSIDWDDAPPSRWSIFGCDLPCRHPGAPQHWPSACGGRGTRERATSFDVLTGFVTRGSADAGEIRRHRQLAGVDGMVAPRRRDADFVPSVQLAGRIINVAVAPGDDHTPLDGALRQSRGLEVAQRQDDLGHGLQRPGHEARALLLAR